jgi:hypothetical protein
VKSKRHLLLPIVFMVVFALTRIPGLLPLNFSAAYALVFCAGVYLPGRFGWWFPLCLMAVSDVALNCYYEFYLGIDAFTPYQLITYVGFAFLIFLGRRFRPRDSWMLLVAGGLAGAVAFYLITNTAAWLFNPFGNPEYTKDLHGWLVALTKGTGGYPATWMFFKNTLLSGGLFTGLFVGAMKLCEATEPEPAEAEEPAASDPEETQPEESKS